MLVRIDWAPRPDQPSTAGKMYHVYQAGDYFVEILGWSGSSTGDSAPSKVRLMLDGDKHDISLSGGDEAFIMNDSGKTVDCIRTI